MKQEKKGATNAKLVLLGSFIGTTVEWYDFFLYGTAAALVFNSLFFPEISPIAGVMAAFGTYAVGFLARPVGGIVAGHFGDRIGRKALLVIALLIMGVCSTLIGFLPTYGQIGIWAPILLLLLRIGQGLGVGGEWGGAALMSVEHAPPGKRGLYGSFTQIGVSAGMLLGVGAFTLFRVTLDHASFMAWGWRVPFIFSIVLVVLGLLIRLQLEESPQFQEMQEQGDVESNPVGVVLTSERRATILTVGMRISQNAVYYLYTVFGIAYVAQALDHSSNAALFAVMIASAIGLVSVPIWAAISDRVGRRPIYLFGAVGSAVFILPYFLLAGSGSLVLIIVATVVALVIFHDSMYGPQAAFFSEMFPVRVRYSGASFAYQAGSVLGGGFSPLIATALLALGDGSPVYVVIYFAILSIITAVCTYLAPETNKANIGHDTDATKAMYADKSQPMETV